MDKGSNSEQHKHEKKEEPQHHIHHHPNQQGHHPEHHPEHEHKPEHHIQHHSEEHYVHHHPQHNQEHHNMKPTNIEGKLVENLILLQKVNTDLAEKFNKLTNQISSLLTLFETAARSFASSPAVQSSEKDKEFLEKINRLLDQNKTIAKGLTLMEERIRERVYGQSIPSPISAPKESGMEMPARTEMHPEDEFKPSMIGKPLPKF